MVTASKKVTIVSIEGNIGSGKSSLLKKLQKYLEEYKLNEKIKYVFVPEPVDIWEKMGILSKFYTDQKRWTFTFQIFVYITRITKIYDAVQKNIKDLKEDEKLVVVGERSILADKDIFMKTSVENKNADAKEDEVYNYIYEKWNEIIEAKELMPQGLIFINTEPEICQTRIDQRKRKSEFDENKALIFLNYLKQLDQKHHLWIQECEKNHFPVLVLTNNIDENQEKLYQEEIQTVMEFIKKLM